MNIFILDKDPKISAQYHTDIHVRKMILESASMMTLAHDKSTLPPHIATYWQKTHKNNHCTIWVRTSKENYEWIGELAKALCHEYTYRHKQNKVHATEEIITWLINNPPSLPSIGITPFRRAIAGDCKLIPDIIEAYRDYYIYYKQHLIGWTNREKPSWYVAEDYAI